MRRSSRNKRESAKNKIMYSIILIFVLAVFAIISGFALLHSPLTYDEQTLCRDDGNIPQHDVILIDATDEIRETEMNEIKEWIKELVDEQEVDSKLTILTFSGEEDFFVRQIFSLCNPGKGEKFDPFTNSKRRKDQYWNKKFGTVLDGLDLTEIPQANSTPLFQSLETILRKRDFRDNIEYRKLHIVSDLLHNYPPFSLYDEKSLNFEKFFQSPHYENFDVDLSKVEVNIYRIFRPKYKKLQGKNQKYFWNKLLREWGASEVYFER